MIAFFCLSGLRCHLSGLSELPLEQCLLLFLAGEPFSFFFILFQKSLPFPFLCSFYVCFNTYHTYEHVVENLPLTQHSNSTAQSTLHKAAKQVHAGRRMEADRVDVSEHVVEHLQSSLVFSRRTKKPKLPVLQKITTTREAA